MTTLPNPKGDKNREAIDSLRGYVYQIYQSVTAWIELEHGEFLFLEVAEDYAVVATDALNAVQVKETGHIVTINSEDIIASIDSFVDLKHKNPELQVKLRHLTTSKIGKEKSAEHRIGDTPTLEAWRKLARTGDVTPFRHILNNSKLSKKTKDYINTLDNIAFREEFLKRIHFDCGALETKFLIRQLHSKLLKLILGRGGINSQVESCLSSMLVAILHKTTQKTDRFVDRIMLEELLEKTTQIPINRAQFEIQNQLINKILAASVPQATNMFASRLADPRPIDEVPFPAAIASRTIQIDNIMSSLTQYGVSWIYGAAGVGKTIGAKIAARWLRGNWVSINLRGFHSEQVNSVLLNVINILTEQKVDGLLVDDLECSFEPYIIDTLLYLRALCDRMDSSILFISSKPPNSDFLFSANIPTSIGQKFEEFSEQDIQEILDGLDVAGKGWAKYIHIISGGGHPQLAIAAIQNMQHNKWDTNEFRTFSSLLNGNIAIEQVRATTRERLLNELPEGSRRLLERLSLKLGGFRRNFVLDMAQVIPVIPDGGIIFDQLIGSWIDQQERDRFALSPLLSNFAINTLTDEQKRKINFEIANSLVNKRSLDPIEANSALFAALSGKNTWVIAHLCLSLLTENQNIIEAISPHLIILTFMRIDNLAYEDDLVINQIFRGAQLILTCQEESDKEKFQKVLERFEMESNLVEDKVSSSLMMTAVYSKILLSEPKYGAFPYFFNIVRKLDILIEGQRTNLPPEAQEALIAQEFDGISLIGLMFLNQARQIKLIEELLIVFNFIDSCEREFRQKLFQPFDTVKFEIDTLISGAWLSEHNANTIDPVKHEDIFFQLEKFSQSWKYTNIAVCCRKYRAIIIDEYGNDKNKALEVLDEGLKYYGITNSELVRAKAKVLYRAGDYQISLELSTDLIERNAPLYETEKVFLGREAAISAENQGKYEMARRYYLYASKAAANCNIADMKSMQVGLLADAALASWHTGDRETCLRDFTNTLKELNGIDPNSSLQASHCHAICRHVLLWLDQDVTGKKKVLENGEETKIYPGVVSNPEPHPKIGERNITPIEIAWYQLAAIENHAFLDIGITQNLKSLLPNGAILEGQLLLLNPKMKKALTLIDDNLFTSTLKEFIFAFSHIQKSIDFKNGLNLNKVTYGSFPKPTLNELISLSGVTEQFILCFSSICIFSGKTSTLDRLVESLKEEQCFMVKKEFLDSFQGKTSTLNYNTSLAGLLMIHRNAIEMNRESLPLQVFELAFKALQVSTQVNSLKVVARFAFEWLNTKLAFILKQQRFQLRLPALYEPNIIQALSARGDSWIEKTVNLLLAMLPTLGISNENELRHILSNLKNTGR